MFRSIFSIILVVLLGLNNAQAQAGRPFDNFFTFAWDVNIPLGDKFVDATSWAGGKLEYRKMISDNMSVGLDLSWNSYYEYKEYQTFHVDANTDVTTDLFKYNYTLPIALTSHYYFENGGLFLPYVGLGMGAVYGSPRVYFNIYEFDEENWGFLLRPEVGTVIRFDQEGTMGILLAARYSMSTNEEPKIGMKNLQSLGFNLGLAWTY